EHCPQTGDTGGVSSTVAAVDVVGADDRPGELLREIIQLVRGLGAAVTAERVGAVARLQVGGTVCGGAGGRGRGGGLQLAIDTHERLGQAAEVDVHDYNSVR